MPHDGVVPVADRREVERAVDVEDGVEVGVETRELPRVELDAKRLGALGERDAQSLSEIALPCMNSPR
jgi:hypothetical protein